MNQPKQQWKLKNSIKIDGVPVPPFHYSHAIKAGNFLFLSGIIASDFEDGIVAEAGVDPKLPYHSSPSQSQTEWIYRRTGRILEAAGTSFDNLVRTDQFFLARSDEKLPSYYRPAYVSTRDSFLVHDRPGSTSIDRSRLLIPDAVILINQFAIIPSEGFTKRTFNPTNVPQPLSGYSMVTRTGDWVWCAGTTASFFKSDAPYYGAIGTSLAPEARIDPNFSYEYPLSKQLNYIVKKKLASYLEMAGSSLEHVVKAQVYVRADEMKNFWSFNQLWKEIFAQKPPATVIIPVPYLGQTQTRIEISLMALVTEGAIKPEIISVPRGNGTLGHFPEAIRAGNLLLLSGQLAATSQGYHPSARVNPKQPYLSSAAKLEMQVIIDNIRGICEAAGGSIDSVVKADFFFSDLRDVLPAMEVWGAAFGEDPPAITIAQTDAPQLIPEARMTVDVYAAL